MRSLATHDALAVRGAGTVDGSVPRHVDDYRRRLLYAAVFWERIGYHGLLAILIFYLTDSGSSGAEASALFGNFASVVYAATLVGAVVADVWLGIRRAALFGAIVVLVGHVALTNAGLLDVGDPNSLALFAGLGLVIVGEGYLQPAIANLLSEYSGSVDTKRDASFSVFWMVQNAGVLLGPLLIGWVAHAFGWGYGFAGDAAAMAIALVLLRLAARRAPDAADVREAPVAGAEPARSRRRRLVAYVAAPFAAVGTAFLMRETALVGVLLASVLLAAVARYLFVALRRCTPSERQRSLMCLVVAAFSFVFLVLLNQYGTALALFTAEHVDLDLFGVTLQPSQVIFLQPTFLVLLGPPYLAACARLARAGREPSPFAKMAAGLGSLSLAFLALGLAANHAPDGERLAIGWMVGFYFVMAAGELLLCPVSLALTTKLAVPRMAGLTVGLWMLSWSWANYVAALGATTIWHARVGAAPVGSLGRFGDYFYSMAAIGVATSVLMLVLLPMLRHRIAASSAHAA
jgi:POT family proton-dependent oligopeptide transporter